MYIHTLTGSIYTHWLYIHSLALYTLTGLTGSIYTHWLYILIDKTLSPPPTCTYYLNYLLPLTLYGTPYSLITTWYPCTVTLYSLYIVSLLPGTPAQCYCYLFCSLFLLFNPALLGKGLYISISRSAHETFINIYYIYFCPFKSRAIDWCLLANRIRTF